MHVWYSDVPPSCCSTCFLHISCSPKRAIISPQPWTLEEEDNEEEEEERDGEWIIFLPSTLKSEPSPSYCFVLKSSLPNADKRNGNGKNGSIKATESSTGRADVSINVRGTLRNAECASGIKPGSGTQTTIRNERNRTTKSLITNIKRVQPWQVLQDVEIILRLWDDSLGSDVISALLVHTYTHASLHHLRGPGYSLQVYLWTN